MISIDATVVAPTEEEAIDECKGRWDFDNELIGDIDEIDVEEIPE